MASFGFGTPLPMSSPQTPSGVNSSSAKKASSKPEALANPLLARNGRPSMTPLGGDSMFASIHRPPLTPVNNANGEGLRQRRISKEEKGTDGFSSWAPPPQANLFMEGAVLPKTKDQQNVVNESNGVAPFSRALDDSYDRWVLVYGYATAAQYDAILRRFDSYGKVTSRRGTCSPGKSNWVALEYESSLQAEKALCQQHCKLLDGIIVGVTRMDPSLRQSLEWNAVAPPPSVTDEGYANSLRLDDKFRSSLGQSTNFAMGEQDVLLTNKAVGSRSDSGRKSVWEQILGWAFGW